jgi:hypothetical protein
MPLHNRPRTRITCICRLILAAIVLLPALARAQSTIDLTQPPAAPIEGTLKVGGKNPAGLEINANTQYLTLGGKPWTPDMGEFHYMRYPRADWDQEMRKMKAGGINLLSTYVIWIYHEETQGQFDWSGNRTHLHFIAACKKDLRSLHIGPGSLREATTAACPNGSSINAAAASFEDQFMAFTKTFYEQTFNQVKACPGRMAAHRRHQIDNRSTSNPYLLALKQLAINVGFDAPSTASPPGTTSAPKFRLRSHVRLSRWLLVR